MTDWGVTQEDRELAGVVDDLARIIELGQDDTTPNREDRYWAEELIPPMTDEPDEVIDGMKLDGHYLPEGTQLGFTLWRGDNSYRISVSKLP